MFLLTIKTLNDNTLTYKVHDYSIKDGQIIFYTREGLQKRFSLTRVDIEEVRE